MKRFAVLLHPGAIEDIRNAYEGILLRAPEGAARWHAGLVQFAESMATMPEGYPVAREDEDFNAGLRCASYRRPHGRTTYRFLFVIREETVHVVALRHSSRDQDSETLHGRLRKIVEDTGQGRSPGQK